MIDTPRIITRLCDGDGYTKYGVVWKGRYWFTVAELEEMKQEEE